MVKLRFLILATLLGIGSAHAEERVFGPKDDWCAAFKSAKPGDEILLRKGVYLKPCTIRAKGAPGNPIVLRSQSAVLGNRAVVAYAGSTANVIDVRASAHLLIQDLDITARSTQVEGIKLYDVDDVVIQRCRFHRLNGVSISANGADSNGVVIRGNEFKNLKATAIYLGCHDGKHCRARNARIEGNLIDGAMPKDDRVGYGMQIKLNSDAVIRDNTLYSTKGPGIMVYGNEDPEGTPSLIEGNYVQRSAWESGILIGGGPVIVRNNVSVDHGLFGIATQNYKGRGLQHGIKIVHNTLLNNLRGGISVDGWLIGSDNVIANNLVAGVPDQQPIKPPRPNGIINGNAFCPTASDCLFQPDQAPFDLRLNPKSELRGTREMGPEDWWPKDDFLGLKRELPTSPGAFEGRYPPEFDKLELGKYKPRPQRSRE
ncbi:MAG: right-handed parallel beta-helix repeat-containing protein [Gammaproteobacteria bacterium]|nr:right-handed parallel beta-helix repeat-containing protein [Gammaproteobacteria bacterium]MCP5136398.1 right-handed parallel beta-helix repeat-containing protein [Gammaproteobacteria bacterium]